MVYKTIKRAYAEVVIGSIDNTNKIQEIVTNHVDFGAVTLSANNRELILDTSEVYFNQTTLSDGKIVLECDCKLFTDEEIFGKNTLRISDLFSNELKTEMYVSMGNDELNETYPIESIKLLLDIGLAEVKINVSLS
jgi:hypothetical protein